MRRQLALVIWSALALSALAYVAIAQEALPSDATLASVAHAHGMRGGDLAEALGLPRGVTNKNQPLVEMGITPEQLEAALNELGMTPDANVTGGRELDVSMSIREIASALGMTERELARDLNLDIDVDKDTAIAQLSVDQETLDAAIAHERSHHTERVLPAESKYPVFALISLFAMLYLLKWGIPKNGERKKRSRYYANWVYILVLLVSVGALGFLVGKSPNAMEGTVKVFKATVGLYDSVWPMIGALAFFLALGIIANKVICGWACPFGALEELIYMIPGLKQAKGWRLPFWVTNSVRAGLFAVTLLILYGVVGGNKGFVVYHYLNPFNLFNLDFMVPIIGYFTVGYLVVSFFYYRPFCQLICPFGFVSWICERVSLNRIRIDRERCIDCRACAKACPLTAAADRLDRKVLEADCFSCMRCLRVCPADAIHYRPVWAPPSPEKIQEAEEAA